MEKGSKDCLEVGQHITDRGCPACGEKVDTEEPHGLTMFDGLFRTFHMGPCDALVGVVKDTGRYEDLPFREPTRATP